ncbi:MAG: potassium transporter [Leptolyngbyaceae cyanobacterium SL_1_1]|nr:potassium transporter [Leptolyngbyaceae cyanobacterium RM1_1_2]NJO09413.1 potassium transporter [Leptolyngbyaceae cyanobacterium SL_1_1]
MNVSSTHLQQPNFKPTSDSDHFLVCGLGSLGQHCVANLKTFGVKVSAIDRTMAEHWEIANLPDLLENLLVGDCRYADALHRAGVSHCRAALIVTDSERVNIEAALTARVLNPHIRLVVRSDQQNLNQVLAHQLDNFVAFEPTQLSASAFALAAFGDHLKGFFQLDGYRFKVVKQQITSEHRWCDRRRLYQIENRNRRVLRHFAANTLGLSPTQISQTTNPFSPSAQFYTWLPNTLVRAGDTVVTIEAEPERTLPGNQSKAKRQLHKVLWQKLRSLRSWRDLRQSLVQLWQTNYQNQVRRVVLLCAITIVVLCFAGTLLLWFNYPALSVLDAFYATVVLLLGGYGDLFSEFVPAVVLPWWLRLFSLGLTLAGTAFIGVLYALLTEKLLTLKFQFLTRRPPVPQKGHVIVLGLGRVGRRVMGLLQELNQPVVGVAPQELEPHVLPQLPIIMSDKAEMLIKANLETAKSLIAVGDDEVQNLEMGLMAYRTNSSCRLIIRTYDQRFTDKVAQLFPYTQVLCTSALSAEAFAGAAFGENVISLFPLYGQTMLVTQYRVEPEDTLHGQLLAEVAYGYGVVPILYQPAAQGNPRMMPSEDIRLRIGDRLIVLATIRGLQRIEQGRLAEQQWRIQVESANTQEARFGGSAEIARVSGCDLNLARTFIEQLPSIFPQTLYRHQALRLVRELVKLQVQVRILPP